MPTSDKFSELLAQKSQAPDREGVAEDCDDDVDPLDAFMATEILPEARKGTFNGGRRPLSVSF